MKNFLTLAFLLWCLPASFGQTRLVHRPAYHKGNVVFHYRGDLWTAQEAGGTARRLTEAKGVKDYPRFSPDGRWIAFSWNRAGNSDVYAMPAAGGEPRQLTFHDANDTVAGWTPDSRKVLFSSQRGGLYPGTSNLGGVPTLMGPPELFVVPVEGGCEERLPLDRGYSGTYSMDGRKLVFNRNHLMQWWRKHYRGSGATEIWVLDTVSRQFRNLKIEGYRGHHSWPMYASDGNIYFVADPLPNEKSIKPGSPEVMKSVSNIWRISERGAAAQVTHHPTGNVYYPSISPDGRTIVYEAEFGIWKLDVATGRASQIRVQVDSGGGPPMKEQRTYAGQAEAFHLHPGGERSAISARGGIYSVPLDRGEVRRLAEAQGRDADPKWSPDGAWLAFSSDRSGREGIWLVKQDGSGLRKLIDSDLQKHAIVWAPDSRSLLYGTWDNKLYGVDLASGSRRQIASMPAEFDDVHFSPDGKWISYSRRGRGGDRTVYVIPSAGGEERGIQCEECIASWNARWTPDGSKIMFVGGDVGESRSAKAEIFEAGLRKETDPADSAVRAKNIPVVIEWSGIERRIRRSGKWSGAGSPSGFELSPDGTLCAVAVREPRPGIFVAHADGSRMRAVASRQDGVPSNAMRLSSMQFSPDGRKLMFRDGNALFAVALDGDANAAPVARLQWRFKIDIEVDRRAEWKQIFGEIWRQFKNLYYYPNMGGADWAKAKSVYEPLLDEIEQPFEFQEVTDLMIGELNVSHARRQAPPAGRQGGGAGGAASAKPSRTRHPGFALEADSSGYYKVARIYRNGPADRDWIKLKAGDFILSIDGQDLKVPGNYWKYYYGPLDRKLEFVVNSKPGGEGAWKVRIAPVDTGADGLLRYREWVAAKRETVERLSRGEATYVHIRQMDPEPRQEFERELVKYRYKSGIIIDVRFNPGGGVDQQLLQALTARHYEVVRSPHSITELTRPSRTYAGALVVLQSEKSSSDSELFTGGVRALKLGKLVGTATYGAAILQTMIQLVDGSTVSVANRPIITTDGHDLENWGVPPDVYVDNTPEDFLAGRDAQLTRSVEVILQQIRSRK